MEELDCTGVDNRGGKQGKSKFFRQDLEGIVKILATQRDVITGIGCRTRVKLKN